MGEVAPRRKATYQDVLDAPEHVTAEIIDGELYTSPRPAPPHALASSAIASVLFTTFGRRVGEPQAPGGWWILFEPELHLSGEILVPDVAGWRRERMPSLPGDRFFGLAPDWVCEVLSPSSVRVDRVDKKRVYARERVAFLWLVDPLAQTLEVLRLGGDLWQEVSSHADGERVRACPFEVLEIDLALWWATE